MAEWVTIQAAAMASGYSRNGLYYALKRGLLPLEYVRRRGKLYDVDAAIIPWLIERKQEWHAAIKQPDGVIHVPDPLGIQEGLWLTPDEAQRLLAIREQHRRYPTAQECNKTMESDG